MSSSSRAWLPVLFFLAGFAATAAALRQIDPFFEVPTVREKWRHWQAHKHHYDTLFIGTSRTYRGIIPSKFDALTAAAGIPTRSFNFGVDGMFSPEDWFVIEHTLANPPRNLKWVFIEVGGLMHEFKDREPNSLRSVYWHDWPRTQLCIRALLWPRKKAGEWQKWFAPRSRGRDPIAVVVGGHLEAMAMHLLSMGRGANYLSEKLRPGKGGDPLGAEADGFCPMPGDGSMSGEALAIFRRMMDERRTKPFRGQPIDPYTQEALDALAAMFRKLGARTIAIMSPVPGARQDYPAPDPALPVLDFSDLESFPELFAEDQRTDLAHMNAQGAVLYTQRLAEEFTALIANDFTPVRPPLLPHR
jgi:hypothetical protein